MRRIFIAAALLALLALGVTACGESGSSGPEPVQPTVSAATPSTVDATSAPVGLRVPTDGWRTDFTRHVVPLDEFWQAVPLKDGIPSLDEPAFISIDEAATTIEGLEPVIEVELDGEARAYPLQIMIWHEIVNDTIRGVPVVVTFCPLCYSALAFERTLDGEVYEFGVSGNLRNSDLVMYDRTTETWWQQFNGQAVVGELAGAELTPVPAAIVSLDDFGARHPDGLVLSPDTGFDKAYGLNPYPGYDRIDRPVTRVLENEDDRLPPRARVVELVRGDEAVVVPFADLAERSRIEVEVGGEQLEVLWIESVRSALDEVDIATGEIGGSAEVRSLETGERVPFGTPFWFAVAAFRPDAQIVVE